MINMNVVQIDPVLYNKDKRLTLLFIFARSPFSFLPLQVFPRPINL